MRAGVMRACLLLTLCSSVVPAASGELPFLRHPQPPPGATYESTLALPVIGRQTLELNIVDDTCARVRLSGALTLDEPLQWGVSRETGELFFVLSERTKRLLRRLGVTLREAYYAAPSDEAVVVVSPPLIPSIRIQLSRLESGGTHLGPGKKCAERIR
mmetsp:Transcript_11677/g.28437  ORF Transcript_11677/g.28437 Transcript_11677/m.28437 type:complete len:158 (+) Transcript_11677:3-476(+)